MKYLFALLLLASSLSWGQGFGGKLGIGGKGGYGGGPPSANVGSWTAIQAMGLGLGTASTCTSGTTTTCTWPLIATTANSGLALAAVTSNNVTLTGVSGCGGTWHTGIGGHVFDAAVGNIDTAYNVTNTGGCTSLTVTVSGAPGTSIWTGIVVQVVEFLPPTGATASLDQVSTVDDASCSTSCALAAFSSGTALTATDAVVQFNNSTFTMTSCVDVAAVSSSSCAGTYSSPYQIDYNGNALVLNAPSGSLTGTGKQRNPSGSASGIVTFSAIAFKSSFGSYTVSPTAIWTPTSSNFFTQGTAVSCTPTCALTIPAMTGSDLAILCSQSTAAAGATAYISSVSGGGTWVHAANTRIGKAAYGAQDCWYVLSDTASTTTVTPTMNASLSNAYYFGFYEFNKSSGTAVFDAAASTDNSGSSTSSPAGQAVTITGTDDLCFQLIQMPLATNGLWEVTNFPYPYNAWTNTNGQNYSNSNNAGAVGYTMNVASMPSATWLTYNAISAGSLVAGMCFQ